MIARAMVHQPKVLILDEPTAGVDIEIRRSMWDYMLQLKKQGCTIVLTTHYLEEAEYLCDRIAIINKGEIIRDAPKAELIGELSSQSFIFDLVQPVSKTLSLDGYQLEMLSPTQALVTMKTGQSLNDVLAYFSAEGVIVGSMRNQANRLEELFLNLTSRLGGEA